MLGDSMLKNNMDTILEKLKIWLEANRIAVITCLSLVLLGLVFYAGVTFSCRKGILTGLQCVQPVNIGVVSFCEIDAFNCASKCGEFIVNNITTFCSDYDINKFTAP